MMPSEQDAPSRQLVMQRLRNRIVEYLELAASFGKQQAYQAEVPAVSVTNEVINQWEDWFSGDASTYCEPVFTDAERAALTLFHNTWSAVADATPHPVPSLGEVQHLPEWNELRLAADAALLAFAERGRMPEDVEI